MHTVAAIPEEVIPILAICGSFLFGMGWLAVYGLTTRRKTIERERTRRELAAYIAEGTMTPDDAERIMRAGDTDAS